MHVGPKTLEELLAVLPGARKLRGLNAATLRWLLDRDRKECTWCGQKVGKGRSTWCSDACVREFRLRCDPAAQAGAVINRDGVCCAICGRDTRQSERDFRAAKIAEEREQVANGGQWYLGKERRENLQRDHGGAGGRFIEVDHIVPVSEGGGLCDITNLRVLCGNCHQDETRALRKRLAKS